MTAILLLQIFLWLWFLGCIITYRFGRAYLVEGMGIKSAEFVMLCLYSVGMVLFYVYPTIGKWVLLTVLVLWFIIQFFCHWYFTIFGASEKKLKGYNECFRGTLRLFPMSEKKLVPDLYHIILHLLIFLNTILLLI